jgi:hypothetical protein
MNKEQEELLDETYRKYADSHWTPPSNPEGKLLSDQLFSLIPMEHSKESFINKIKTDEEFAQKWGLKIEELELSDKEETYSIPIYENGIKTEWSVDGIVGDEKYKQLTEMSPEGKLPIIINTNTKK